jgi:hypothetical protein
MNMSNIITKDSQVSPSSVQQSENAQFSSGIPPQLMMLQMIKSYWISQLIYTVAKLGIADLLKDAPLNCEKLASSTGTHPRSLYRIMRALASVGIFAQNQEGYFTLTPLASYLISDVPDSVRAAAIMLGEEHYQAWGNILHSIRTGTSSFEYLYKTDLFQYYEQNPESAKIFSEAMTSVSAIDNIAVTKAYNFSKIQKLVDVGGGQGSLIAYILKSNANLQGILFDQPSVIKSTKYFLETQGLSSRCEVISGDFFKSVPRGGDAYILRHILHDWDDERALVILKHCHEAMKENALLLLVEMVIPPGNEPSLGKFIDINMLIMCHAGCERTEAEYQALLERAGFQLRKIFTTETDINIIEAIRI